MLDVGERLFGIGFAQIHTIMRGDILLVEVAVAGAGFRRHGHNVTYDVRNRAIAGRMETSDFDHGVIRAPVPHKGVTVACRGARPEIDVVSPLSLGNGPAFERWRHRR